MCFTGPARVHTPNGISVGSAVFARLTIVTDRPTDRPRYSVRNNRPHLYVVVRCGLKTENLAGLVFLLVAGGSGALEPARGATTFSKLGGGSSALV